MCNHWCCCIIIELSYLCCCRYTGCIHSLILYTSRLGWDRYIIRIMEFTRDSKESVLIYSILYCIACRIIWCLTRDNQCEWGIKSTWWSGRSRKWCWSDIEIVDILRISESSSWIRNNTNRENCPSIGSCHDREVSYSIRGTRSNSYIVGIIDCELHLRIPMSCYRSNCWIPYSRSVWFSWYRWTNHNMWNFIPFEHIRISCVKHICKEEHLLTSELELCPRFMNFYITSRLDIIDILIFCESSIIKSIDSRWVIATIGCDNVCFSFGLKYIKS